MRILIAPDSFKECLSAADVASSMADGVKRIAPDAEILEVPMADGGEGTVDALVQATGGTFHRKTVRGPLGDPVEATYGLLGNGRTAVIEMAAASGLMLVPPDQRDPLAASTFGTGELIQAAVERGAIHLIVGIGGSATNDGGAGMAQALGYSLLDADGNEIPPGGAGLEHLARIDPSGVFPGLADVMIEVACDVTNPLTGPTGASATYGPQKGATPEMVATLDGCLKHFAERIRADVGIDVEHVPGAGAAGGLGGGLMAFTGATLRRGIDLVIEAVDLAGKAEGAELCLTGEGAIDHSSQFGKTAVGVAACCKRKSVPVIALAGALKPGVEAVLDHGIDAYFSITPRPGTLADAYAEAKERLANTAEQVMRLYVVAKR
ncbi:Glycerate 2-kinase [Planctomycetes bacterium Pan216]|uniref:Glycerate 2-kinase n=1 Tax=Kolteria novifilia TaxID=2527975 RepID=A0A518BCY4_9BACT|nr:Glycerate 2-kinase [Planctomycetes bacterium Pan216]